MASIIDRILEKRRIKSFDELSSEERSTLLQWQKILGEKDITIEDLKKFMPMELDRANRELRKFENSEKKQLFYQVYATLLTNLIQVIATPAAQRDQLRRYLKQNLDIEI